MDKIEQDIKTFGFKLEELHPLGCGRVVQEAIRGAFTGSSITRIPRGSRNFLLEQAKRLKNIVDNGLVGMFCAVYGYDEEKIISKCKKKANELSVLAEARWH